MATQIHPRAYEAIAFIRQDAIRAIRNSVRSLLQERHLYQSIDMPMGEVTTGHACSSDTDLRIVGNFTNGARRWHWHVIDDLQAQPAGTNDLEVFEWQAPDVKLHCSTCDRVEAFNLVHGANFLNRSAVFGEGIGDEQVYVLSYLCQACKRVPQVFLVRRKGHRLTLSGRVPMESVEMPKTIPKVVAKYYTGAVIAYQSGQTLAGIFMLRTFCEQWARKFAPADAMADASIEAYMDSLPDDFKGRFKSIRELYGELSVAVHSASEDKELFDTSLFYISQHFAARALFGLPGPSTTSPDAAPAPAADTASSGG